MQVNAISSYNKGFTGSKQDFSVVDEIIAQDDKTVRDYAYHTSMQKVNDKKHKKIANAIWYSIPVVAGLSAALLTKGKSSMFGKELTGLGAKISNGIKYALPWAVTLGIADAVVGGNKIVAENAPAVRDAERKHPFLTLIGVLGVGITALTYAPRGLAKLYSKIGPKTFAKLGNGAEKVSNLFNKIPTPEFLSKIGSKISEKSPSALKSAVKTAVGAAPEALLLATLFHSINHSYDRNHEFKKNYFGMKETQLDLAKSRVVQLKAENDFLSQFPENIENLETLNNPLKDMPEEVIEKVEEIRDERIAKEAEVTEEE